MTPSLHQFVAGFSHGDAISNEARFMRDIFRSWGYESNIYCESKRILPELRQDALDVEEHRSRFSAEDTVLLHLSIGSVANDIFADLPCKKAILYHNVTPPDFFRGLNEEIAHHLTRGLEQVKLLANTADVVMADSQFNANELIGYGYKDVSVLPLILDLDRLRDKPNRAILKKYKDGLTNIVFVGRGAPNKRVEDCLAAFHYFQKTIEPLSRFIHVGSYAGLERYHALMLTQSRDLKLQNVDLMGSRRQDELNAVFEAAHLFLCMSEHEGFCIPLIESMVHSVPILAYEAAAVPETMDGCGVLFNEKSFDHIAEMMGQLTRNHALREAVIKGQRARLEAYARRDLKAELQGHLAPLL